jgi:malic enzyme
MYNRSTAFSPEDRRELGLEGLLPDVVSSMEQQARRAYASIVRRTEPLDRYLGLAALQDRNEHLFYRVLGEHIEEFIPIVYAPTAAQACRQYGRIHRRARGLWITPEHRGRMTEVLANSPYEDVRLIVATDNERVLGLGDEGAGGMGLPIGKLALYVAAAGVHPAQTLPVSLDIGTDNQELLRDDLYIGWRQPRLRGDAFDGFVEEFVRAVKLRFPKAVLQWEDLAPANASRLLDRYRGEIASFSDDIQCSAAAAVSGLLAASRAAGRAPADERLVIVGSDARAEAIARLFELALRSAGVEEEASQSAVQLLGPDGLAGAALLDVVRATRPTALVGACGVPGLFGEEVVRTLAAQVERPAVFALSSAGGGAEACPADLLAWTDGRALVATGAASDAAGTALRPAGAVSQPTGAASHPGGAVSQPAGAVSQPIGAASHPGGAVSQPTAAASHSGGGSPSAGMTSHSAGTASHSAGAALHPAGATSHSAGAPSGAAAGASRAAAATNRCSSVFVFPGVGLGAVVCEAREVTDGMLAAAAAALAAQPTSEELAAGSLFPPLARVRSVTARVAEAVVRQASSEGVARNPPLDPAEAVHAAMWDPAYPAIDVV